MNRAAWRLLRETKQHAMEATGSAIAAKPTSQRNMGFPFGLPEVLVAVHTSRLSCKGGWESANIHAGSGVIC